MPHRKNPPITTPPRLNWPQPLWLHLGSAWSCLSNAVNGWMMSQNGSMRWTEPHHSAAHQLLKQAKQNALAPESVAQFIAQHGAQDWQDFLRGLWLYQHHTTQRQSSDWAVIAKHKATALKCLPATHKSKKPPIVLIPSLINRFHILDLHPDQSFAQFLRQNGHDVYLIDWHHDLNQSLPTSLDNCIINHLTPLLDHIPAKSYHMMGYCMGGTLAMAAAQLNVIKIKSLTLMATPWDFHQPDAVGAQKLAAALQNSADEMISANWLQMIFWQRDPLTALSKFLHFARGNTHSHTANIFVLAEDWLNDGVDLPASLLRDCAQTWYAKNASFKKQWRVHNTLIDPLKLKHIPLHIVAAHRDGLVPTASSLCLSKNMRNITTSLFDTGHIGLFAGRKSISTVWPQVQHFLTHHNTRV